MVTTRLRVSKQTLFTALTLLPLLRLVEGQLAVDNTQAVAGDQA
jgi:hypothetical protein